MIENEQTRKLIGIITDRDLALKVVGEGLNTQSTKVEIVMSRKVATCQADDELQRALDTMSTNQLLRIIVVDHVNKVLGIISQADVAVRVNQAEKTAGLVIHTYSKIS